MCANLPTFKPLYPKFASFTSTVRRMYGGLRSGGSGSQHGSATPYGALKDPGSYSARIRASNSGESREGLSLSASAKASAEPGTYELRPVDLNHIHVKNTVDVV
jgi:hypothetical protein